MSPPMLGVCKDGRENWRRSPQHMRTHSTYWAPGTGPGPAGNKQTGRLPCEAQKLVRRRDGAASAGGVRV